MEEVVHPDGWLGRLDRGRVVALVVAALGVGLAVVRMARIAAQSSRVQYSDYWPMLDSLLDDEGGIRWRGLLEARNEHPIAVPKLLYLLNVGLTDGDNHGQAAIVIVLAVVLVVLVGLLAWRTPGMGRTARVAMVVMTAVLVLARQGTWSYAKAMSGTAWLTANAFVVGALVAQQRGRRWLPAVLGALACASYGTGLAAWPALALAGVLIHGRRWQDQWPVWVTGGVVGALYLRWYMFGPERISPRAQTNPFAIAVDGGQLVVGALAPGRAGAVIAVVAAVTAGVALWSCRDRLPVVAPWVGLVAFAAVSAMLIGRSRAGQADGLVTFGGGLASRYWTIVVWAWIGLAGIAVIALRDRIWRAAVPLALAVVVGLGGGDVPARLYGAHENQDLVGVGMQIGLADGNRIGGGFAAHPDITERLREIGHVPFDGSFDLGCGLLGETVEVEPDLPDGVEAEIGGWAIRSSPDVRGFQGTLVTPDGDLECIVVVDAAGTVVGTGPTPSWVDPHRFTLRAIAPTQFFLTVAVRLEPDGPLYVVPKASG